MIKKQEITLRPFRESDGPELVKILERNNQYGYADIEGIAAMKRVASCDAAIFLVAENEQKPCGIIKGVYDGSRALIHLLTVHPEMKDSGIGSMLIEAFREECKSRGVLNLSVTVTEESAGFCEKQGFKALPVFLMIQEFIEETN